MEKNYIYYGILALAAVVGVVYFVQNLPTYGKVSDSAYQYSKSILVATSSKSEKRIEKIRAMLTSSDGLPEGMSEKEHQWLVAILDDADAGNWKVAAEKARKLMEEQVVK